MHVVVATGTIHHLLVGKLEHCLVNSIDEKNHQFALETVRNSAPKRFLRLYYSRVVVVARSRNFGKGRRRRFIGLPFLLDPGLAFSRIHFYNGIVIFLRDFQGKLSHKVPSRVTMTVAVLIIIE
jgi:hypothetical protein